MRQSYIYITKGRYPYGKTGIKRAPVSVTARVVLDLSPMKMEKRKTDCFYIQLAMKHEDYYYDMLALDAAFQGFRLQHFQRILEHPFLVPLALRIASYSSASSEVTKKLFIKNQQFSDPESSNDKPILYLEDIPEPEFYNLETESFSKRRWERGLRVFDDNPSRKKKIKEILFQCHLFALRHDPVFVGNKRVDSRDEEVDSCQKIFQRTTFPIISSYRKRRALEIFSINRPDLVPVLAFQEILRIVKFQRRAPIDKARTVAFLEDAIQNIFPLWLADLGVSPIVSLKELRKKHVRRRNTACRNCGKTLIRRSRLRAEYTICKNCLAKKGRKDKKETAIRNALKRVNWQCELCGKESYLTSNFYRERRSQRGRIFCSNKCYQTFRKRKQRAKQ